MPNFQTGIIGLIGHIQSINFKAIPKSGIKMMMNGGNMQQRGMPKNGRNSLHSGAGGKRPPIVLPTRERTKNAETEKSGKKFDDDKMMMAMVWKRVEMMSECRGAAGEAGKIKMEEMHSGQIRRWHNVYICKTLI
jgi:hypothetical protein